MSQIPCPTEKELKYRFAIALRKGASPFEAIRQAIPDSLLELYRDQLADRYTRSELWPLDPYVLEVLASEEGQPSKEELAGLLWQRIQMCENDEDLAKLTKEYRELRGWVKEKSSIKVDVPGVMLVPTHTTDDDWEKAAEEHQKRLTNAAH